MFSSAEEIERRKQAMADRKAGRKEKKAAKKAAKHQHALGKEGQKFYAERMERRRTCAVVAAEESGKGEAIPMRRMETKGRQRQELESSGGEEEVGETFELPRRSAQRQETSEQELYDPPEGRRRRGAGGGREARPRSVSLSQTGSLPRYEREDRLERWSVGSGEESSIGGRRRGSRGREIV